MDKAMQQIKAKRQLLKAKTWAMGLFLVALVLFVLSNLLLEQHVIWPYVKAFAEAAMVGAIADWFAVVALFRHPMGLPIPHTAILPKNQNRIAEQLGSFIEHNFLQASAIAKRILNIAPSQKALSWLQKDQQQQKVAGMVAQQVPMLLRTIEPKQMAEFVTGLLAKQYSGKSLAISVSKLLHLLSKEQYQQVFLVAILKQIRTWLAHEETRLQLEASITDWAARIEGNNPSRWDKLLAVFKGSAMDVVDGWLAKKVLDWADGYLVEVLDNPEHSMRKNVDRQIEHMVHRLKYSPVWHKRLDTIKNQISQSDEVEQMLAKLWQSLLLWSEKDSVASDSVLQLQIEKILTHIVEKAIAKPEVLRAWDVKLAILTKEWVNEYKHHASLFVTDKVKAWDSQALVEKLELSVGKDLQFIRINGTLVGGLVGLIIHMVSQLLF